MEYGIWLFMCGWHVMVFGAGYLAHVAISRKIWQVRGVTFQYAGQQQSQQASDFAAYNPHHERVS